MIIVITYLVPPSEALASSIPGAIYIGQMAYT